MLNYWFQYLSAAVEWSGILFDVFYIRSGVGQGGVCSTHFLKFIC